MGLIFVDIEAEGITPYSGRMTEFGAVDYKTKKTFHGVLWESEPSPGNPAVSIVTGKEFDDNKVMNDFEQWIKEVSGTSRPIFVSDNPAYDFMWIAYYFDKVLGYNPFGHSGRRIGDFYAGLVNDFYTSQKWKSYRKTPHDHNPVHDAMGNVEAFEVLTHKD